MGVTPIFATCFWGYDMGLKLCRCVSLCVAVPVDGTSHFTRFVAQIGFPTSWCFVAESPVS